MRYRRKMPAEVEAIIYDGSIPHHEVVYAIAKFMGEHEHHRQLVRSERDFWGNTTSSLRIWAEKSQSWCHIDIGDAVIREADGIGCSIYPKAMFEAMFVPAEDEQRQCEYHHCSCECGAGISWGWGDR